MVIATTVGYGARIAPGSVSTQAFCLFYFFYSTMGVGGILGDVSSLYIDFEAEKINNLIIDSTIWVHRIDVHTSKKISEAEYVLFKVRKGKNHSVDFSSHGALTHCNN